MWRLAAVRTHPPGDRQRRSILSRILQRSLRFTGSGFHLEVTFRTSWVCAEPRSAENLTPGREPE